jgi:hypothetical protein
LNEPELRFDVSENKAVVFFLTEFYGLLGICPRTVRGPHLKNHCLRYYADDHREKDEMRGHGAHVEGRKYAYRFFWGGGNGVKSEGENQLEILA